MFKTILLLTFIALLWLAVLSGCSRRPSNSHQAREETISEYLPIRLSDQFRLTALWRHPYVKTYFHESELMVIYRFISSFSFHGPSPPWGDEVLYGVLPILYVTNEEHVIEIQLVGHNQWGHFVLVLADDEPAQWFMVDEDAFIGIIELTREGTWEQPS